MRDKINEEVLCVLVDDTTNDQIGIEYINIENSLSIPLCAFKVLCDGPETTLDELIAFIEHTHEFDQLSDKYGYCVTLGNPYQEFIVNNRETVAEITEQQRIFEINLFQSLSDTPDIPLDELIRIVVESREIDSKSDEYSYCIKLYNSFQKFIITNKNTDKVSEKKEEGDTRFDFNTAIKRYKAQLWNKYNLWGKAYAINNTYQLCKANKNILAYSHRVIGWINFKFCLTSNFSCEIDTNFGYGYSSYFYVKLKYKNIEITPFSEWVQYEYAKFSEIIRYSSSYLLENKNWLDAMEYCQKACNLSTKDEIEFIEKYLIEECEIMANGLERILIEHDFKLKQKKSKITLLACNESEYYSINKEGHELICFRGEKISGAIDFIKKIIEFEQIVSVKSFIDRIELCSVVLQPLLAEDLKVIKLEKDDLDMELVPLNQEYVILNTKFKDYKKQKQMMRKEIIVSKDFEPETIGLKVDSAFLIKFPEVIEFEKNYNRVICNITKCNERISVLETHHKNITSYCNKIRIHSDEKSNAFPLN